jgi:hypothetical protein
MIAVEHEDYAMSEYIALQDPPCLFCGHREILWYNSRIEWLCWWCLELCYQSVLEEEPKDLSTEDRYEQAVDLYCIMAQSAHHPSQ